MALPRRKLFQFLRDLEVLESRELLSGHSIAAGFAHFAPDMQQMRDAAASISQYASVHDGWSRASADHTVLSAALTDASGTATGNLVYSTSTFGGTTHTELKASITGATADTTLDVTVDGTVVGQITTDNNGAGKLLLSSDPHGDEQSLPTDFPTALAAGAAVSVGTITGTLATPTFPGNGGGGCGHDDGTTLTATLTDSVDSTSTATGTVTYSTNTRHDTTNTKLTISVTGAAVSSTLDIAIDDTTIGQLTTDDTGAGKLVFASNPTTGEQALLMNLPYTTIAAGSTVSVGSLTGTFATDTTTTATSHAAGGGFMRHFGRHR